MYQALYIQITCHLVGVPERETTVATASTLYHDLPCRSVATERHFNRVLSWGVSRCTGFLPGSRQPRQPVRLHLSRHVRMNMFLSLFPPGHVREGSKEHKTYH